jgi:hypothetical protein
MSGKKKNNKIDMPSHARFHLFCLHHIQFPSRTPVFGTVRTRAPVQKNGLYPLDTYVCYGIPYVYITNIEIVIIVSYFNIGNIDVYNDDMNLHITNR